MPETKPTVLFVCVHNAGKSQMAAALMRAKAGDSVNVLSGGTHPGDELNGPAKTAAEELGASMDGEFPKAITDEVFMTVDRIVILGNEAKQAGGIGGAVPRFALHLRRELELEYQAFFLCLGRQFVEL